MVVQPNLEICPRRKVCMPAFGRNTVVAVAVPEQSGLAETCPGGEHGSIAAGRLRARVEESEVGFIQRVDSTRIRMDVVDDFDRHVERTSEVSSIERPWEVHAHDPAVDHRAGDAKAGTVDLHLIQETFDQIQEGATTRGWICPETDRLRAIRFEKRKPSLRAAAVTVSTIRNGCATKKTFSPRERAAQNPKMPTRTLQPTCILGMAA